VRPPKQSAAAIEFGTRIAIPMPGSITAPDPIATTMPHTSIRIVIPETTFIGCSEDIETGDIATIPGIVDTKGIGGMTTIAGIGTITEIGGTIRTLLLEYF
jgi:hypothetical protein